MQGITQFRCLNRWKYQMADDLPCWLSFIRPGAVHPMAIEYDSEDGRSLVDITDGEGYLSADGDVWERVETEQECNLCLKAYSVLK